MTTALTVSDIPFGGPEHVFQRVGDGHYRLTVVDQGIEFDVDRVWRDKYELSVSLSCPAASRARAWWTGRSRAATSICRQHRPANDWRSISAIVPRRRMRSIGTDLRDVELLDTCDVAPRLDLSTSRVAQLEREGRIHAARTGSGRRVFLWPDVETFMRQRAVAAQ